MPRSAKVPEVPGSTHGKQKRSEENVGFITAEITPTVNVLFYFILFLGPACGFTPLGKGAPLTSDQITFLL